MTLAVPKTKAGVVGLTAALQALFFVLGGALMSTALYFATGEWSVVPWAVAAPGFSLFGVMLAFSVVSHEQHEDIGVAQRSPKSG